MTSVRRHWTPLKHSHLDSGPRLQGRTHMSTDFVIRKFEFMRLQQLRNHNARLGLPKRPADTGTRSTTEWHIRERRGLASMRETFRAKLVRILPDSGVTMCQING